MVRTVVLYTYLYVQLINGAAASGKLCCVSFKSWGTGCCWGLGRCWAGTGSRHGLGLGLSQAERVFHPLSGI